MQTLEEAYHAVSHVHVTWPGGTERVLTLVDYLLWPGAALLGARAELITRAEAIRLLHRRRGA